MKQTNKSAHRFLKWNDDLSALINERCNELFDQLHAFDVQRSDIDEPGKNYFSAHHTGKRLFFSIESSAHIIYDAVKLTNKSIPDTSFTDYGAGLGTLFLLAGKMDFKQVFYNDLFPVWSNNARIICNELGITITDFITGDINALVEYGEKNKLYFDIIASRNVIEHIYCLRKFYTKLFQSGLAGMFYSTTTANFHNIPMRLKHYWYHRKVEKKYFRNQRKEEILKQAPGIDKNKMTPLVEITRGRAFNDFTTAIELFIDRQPIPKVEFLSTNTCDCVTGVWAENMITRSNYIDIIETAGFSSSYSAGFWDTHYKYAIVNMMTTFFNAIIRLSGKKGYWLSPFVNVVAYPGQQ